MIPVLTQDETERLRELLRDLSVSGTNGIIVNRTGWARFTVSDARPVRKEVQNAGGGGGYTTLVQIELDPSFNVPGGVSTQCGFRYFAYPIGVSRTPENLIVPTSLQPYFRRPAIGAHTAARAGTYAELITLTTADATGRSGPFLWTIPDERMTWEACA